MPAHIGLSKTAQNWLLGRKKLAEELQHLIASQAFSGDADSDFDESDDDWYDDFEEFCQNMVQSDVEYLAKDSYIRLVWDLKPLQLIAIIASAGQEVFRSNAPAHQSRVGWMD